MVSNVEGTPKTKLGSSILQSALDLGGLLWIAQILLILLGCIGIAAALQEGLREQFTMGVLSLITTLVLSRFRPKYLIRLAPAVWVLSLILLVITLSPLAQEVKGVKRWLHFPGFTLQTAEFAKFALIMQLGSALARKGIGSKLWQATLMILLTSVLVFVQPDIGTTVIIFATGIFVMFIAGVRLPSIFILLTTLFVLALPKLDSLLNHAEYAEDRFIYAREGWSVILPEPVFKIFFPEKLTPEQEALLKGSQIDFSHRAIAYGGWWGNGIGSDVNGSLGRKYNLPEADTDFVIGSVGFAMGLLGIAMVLAAYWIIVYVSLKIPELMFRMDITNSQLHAIQIMASSAAFVITFQAAINLGVAVGLVPVTGVPLPLVSRGGTSQIIVGMCLGLIHSALREIRLLQSAKGSQI